MILYNIVEKINNKILESYIGLETLLDYAKPATDIKPGEVPLLPFISAFISIALLSISAGSVREGTLWYDKSEKTRKGCAIAAIGLGGLGLISGLNWFGAKYGIFDNYYFF